VLRQDPDTMLLVRMFDHPLAARGPEGRLTRLRRDVGDWLRAAVQRGQQLGVVRDDLPAPLLVELLVALVATLARWADAGDGRQTAPEGSVAAVVKGALGR